MNLNSKYVSGLVIIIAASIGLFSPVGIIFGSFFLGDNAFFAFPYLILGIITITVGIMFLILLFSPERIRGFQAEYEASPDLTKFKVVKTYPKRGPVMPKIPEVGFCSACGQQIYRPFQCSKCGQILCGKHYLPGSHTCIEDM
ncbi:MAG: AN1-type zinc finger domain-containing protein [Candidatus Hodarchaeota archaeon]